MNLRATEAVLMDSNALPRHNADNQQVAVERRIIALMGIYRFAHLGWFWSTFQLACSLAREYFSFPPPPKKNRKRTYTLVIRRNERQADRRVFDRVPSFRRGDKKKFSVINKIAFI